jgi:hypothetical protein
LGDQVSIADDIARRYGGLATYLYEHAPGGAEPWRCPSVALLAMALERETAATARIQLNDRTGDLAERPRAPLLVFRSTAGRV